VHNNIDPRTFLGDVLDCVLRVRPESRQAFQILGILDYFTQLKDFDDANDIAKQILEA
jgi:lipoprotein NlpI